MAAGERSGGAEGACPDDRWYHPAHAWALVDGSVATFGITWHAQLSLGEVVYYAPPEVGATIHADEGYGELESVKAISDAVAPLRGRVLQVNQRVVDGPELVNADPWGAWLVRVELDDPASARQLLDAAQYAATI